MRTIQLAVAAAISTTMTLGCQGVLAHADTNIEFDGWVKTASFGDPLPFPEAHYHGTVSTDGQLHVWPDCIRGGLSANAPCVDDPTIYWGIDHRKLHWHNITTGQQGDATSDTNGNFTVQTGPGEVNATIYKPFNGLGQASASLVCP